MLVWVILTIAALVFVVSGLVNRGYLTRAWERREKMGSLPRGRRYESDD